MATLTLHDVPEELVAAMERDSHPRDCGHLATAE